MKLTLWARAAIFGCALISTSAALARADVVLDWNAIAIRTLTTQPPTGVNPFFQARFMAITQLAVFEAVNAVNGGYESYLGTPAAPSGASAEAAAIGGRAQGARQLLAGVYGGIHFRFDQVEGGRLGREVATYVCKHNLRKTAK